MDVKGKIFQGSLKKIQLPFYMSGIPLHNSDKNSIILRLVFLWNFTCLNTDLIGALVFFYNGFNVVDFITLTYMAPCIFYSLLANSKALCLWFNLKKIRKLTTKLMKMEEKVKIYNSEEIYLSIRDSFHTVVNLFNIVYVICLGTFLGAPLLAMVFGYYQGNFELIYPFRITYPFDHYRAEVFPVMYFHQSSSSASVLLFISSADYLLYACCSYISSHFKMLQRQFETIINKSNTYKKVTFVDIQAKFEELVQWHQQVISLTSMLESIYAKSTLYNFFSSAALICLTLFNVTAIKDVVYVLTFLSFCSTCLVQIYLLCYFGDKITQASEEVSASVYNSLWYISDSSVGKHLLLVMIRSQKPCKLTALGFADVNQRAFMRILSNAWSYFALLKTIYH